MSGILPRLAQLIVWWPTSQPPPRPRPARLLAATRVAALEREVDEGVAALYGVALREEATRKGG